MSEIALTLPALRPTGTLRDTFTMIGRGMRLSRRNIEAMITSLMLPVMLMQIGRAHV